MVTIESFMALYKDMGDLRLMYRHRQFLQIIGKRRRPKQIYGRMSGKGPLKLIITSIERCESKIRQH